MRYASFFLVLGVVLGAAAVKGRGASLVLLWPTASSALVGIGYAGLGARVFGKRPDGTLDPVCSVLLLPYLALAWLVWRVVRVVRREPAYNTLVEGIIIGRRLAPDEYPEGIASIVDLTCEFPEPKRVRDGRSYRSMPVLDASVPSREDLEALVREISHLRKGVYIHCAEGHGRTATVAAALLLSSGEASSPDEAIELVLQRRPKARLNSQQRETVGSFAAALCGEKSLA